ncbi:MAG: serine protease [bacterium]
MYQQRKGIFEKLEAARGSKVLLYVTGDRRGLETQVHPEVLDLFVDHLDRGVSKRISLVLYTRGGSTLAAWSLVHLIRQFCDRFEVIVPSKAHSAGTLISLGADAIVMTKQATLGPIDPSVNGPLNPQIPGAAPTARFPVSVEAITGYVAFAKSHIGVSDGADLTRVLETLAQHVHPLVLGDVYRSRAQIRMLAERLISRQVPDKDRTTRILEFLCSESGSHDYTIYRKEARDELGLKIEKPDDDQYELIKGLYDDFAAELSLSTPFDPAAFLGQNAVAGYELVRGLIESREGGSHGFVSRGELSRHQIPVAPGVTQTGIQDNRTFEGWERRA